MVGSSSDAGVAASDPDRATARAAPDVASPGERRLRRWLDHQREELGRAESALAEAELARTAADRYLTAHLAALRAAAVVLAIRGQAERTSGPRPSDAGDSITQRVSVRRSGPQNAWWLLAEVAPELAEWAGFFAATQPKRDAIHQGARSVVSTREADDLIRDAAAFLLLVRRGVAAVQNSARRSGLDSCG